MIGPDIDIYSLLHAIGCFVGEGLIKSTLLFIPVFVIHSSVQKRYPLACTAIWHACLGGLLLLPLGMYCLPSWEVGILTRSIAEHQLFPEASVPNTVSVQPLPPVRTISPESTGTRSIDVGAAAESTPSSSIEPTIHAIRPLVWVAKNLPVWVGVAYAIGLLVAVSRLAASLGAVRRLRRSASPLNDPRWQNRLSYWARKLEISHEVVLLRSEHVSLPLVVGLVRPCILIPDALVTRITNIQLETVILHELAHVRRGDYAWQLVLRTVQSIYWCNPLVWLSGNLLSAVRERACDVFCIYQMNSKQDYADSLASLAATVCLRNEVFVGLFVARSSRIIRRLKAIQQARSSEHCLASWKVRTTSVVIVAGAMIGLGALDAGQAVALSAESPVSQSSSNTEALPKPRAELSNSPETSAEGEGTTSLTRENSNSNADWVTSSNLNVARTEHSAVRLLDGRVLVSGGRNDTVALASAEIFDPVAETWALTGSMNEARRVPQSVLLKDGRVLTFSGRAGNVDLATAEIYDPATGMWTSTGSLAHGRFAPLVVRLDDGRVLTAGGFEIGPGFLASCEIYNRATGLWTSTGSYNTSANKQIGVLLNNGKVLSAGGYNGGSTRHENAEIVDPATGLWTNTGFMNERRYSFSGVLLDDGRVLAIAGGNNGTGNNITSEIYNPATGNWTLTGNLQFARRSNLAVKLLGGHVLTAGSGLFPTEIYDPATGLWSSGGNLCSARSEFTMTLLNDGRVLAAGGIEGGLILQSSEIFSAPEPSTIPLAAMFLLTGMEVEEVTEKSKVPEQGAQTKAAALIQDVYADEYEQAKTTEQKAALAQTLLEEGLLTTDDPAGRFVLLKEAGSIAALAGDVDTAFRAAQETAKYFDLSALNLKFALLESAAKSRLPAAKKKTFARVTIPLVEEAIANDEYELAKQLTALALKLGRKSGDRPLLQRLTAMLKLVAAMEKEFEHYKEAVAALENDPTDAKANLTAGEFTCFMKGDWDNGVLMLALGSNDILKAMAEKELSNPTSAADRLHLADEWWALAMEEQDGVAQKQIRIHAARWYQKALPDLAGLARTKANKRVSTAIEANEKSSKRLKESRVRWLPIDEKGKLVHCFTLGPFPKGIDDREVLTFLQKAREGQALLGLRLASVASKPDSGLGVFRGPDDRDTVMYYVFYVSVVKKQSVMYAANTFTRWGHNTVEMFIDQQKVPPTGSVYLLPRTHQFIVKQNHHHSDAPGRSWITRSVLGEGLKQLAPTTVHSGAAEAKPPEVHPPQGQPKDATAG